MTANADARIDTSGPVVSILTPAHNVAPYIGEAISSALQQTFTRFELLVVEDGSTDETATIAEEFAAADPRVRVVRQKNSGPARARNTALRAARGDYLALLDSDDRWMPEFLEVQLATLEAHPEFDVVSANAINVGTDWNGRPWKAVSDTLRPVSILEMIDVEDSICIAAILRRRVAERVGGFDETLQRNEDYDFWLRAALAGCRFAFYGRPLAWYRRRAGSQSASEHDRLAGIVRVLRKARMLCANRAEDLAAIDRKIAKFEHRRLMTGAVAALLEHDFDGAARRFLELDAYSGASVYWLLSGLTRRAPRLLLWAYALKSCIFPPPRTSTSR
jgi:glycosyltransferase involved in cell wall biosynthesis